FERFPDARALADALDAALRVAPVPGTRKDVGAQVKEILDRLAALNEGQMSGIVALHVGTGPIRIDDLGRAPAVLDDASSSFAMGRAEAGAGIAAELPRPAVTIPGLVPPAIPAPGSVAEPAIP